jgi:hypothetical protein
MGMPAIFQRLRVPGPPQLLYVVAIRLMIPLKPGQQGTVRLHCVEARMHPTAGEHRHNSCS